MSTSDGTEPPPSVEAAGERAVAAGGDMEQVATGDHVTQIRRATVLPAQALALGPLTTPVRYLPWRTELFVGRGDELAALDEALSEPGGVAVHAVHGLGGVGKSTLAACWAARRLTDFNPVWWITAETAADVGAGLDALSRALQPSLVGVLAEEALRERALQWLADHGDWLIILDNVADPAHIKPLLERAPRGRFLITTRLGPTTWRGLARLVSLDVLQLSEAVELFTRTSHGSADGVEQLCAELGCLPLAVDQAAAYCREAGISPREYSELLARYPAAMHAAVPEGGEAERTVARVWRVTTDRLGGSLAEMILRIIAWWAPDGIPRSYLSPLGDPLRVTEAIRRLAAHSLVTVRDGTLSVHRLVQAVVRAPQPEDSAPAGAADPVEAARLLAVMLLGGEALRLQAELPSPEEIAEAMKSGEGRVYATHVEALAAHSSCEQDTGETAELFVNAALWLMLVGPSRRAAALGERGWSAALRLFGPDDELTLLARGALDAYRLAMEAWNARDPESMETAMRALAERFGSPSASTPDPDVELEERVRKAADAGDYSRALALSEESVQHYRRRYGDTAFMTLLARGQQLYYVFQAEGLVRAVERARSLLRDVEDAYGESEITELMRQQLQPIIDLGS